MTDPTAEPPDRSPDYPGPANPSAGGPAHPASYQGAPSYQSQPSYQGPPYVGQPASGPAYLAPTQEYPTHAVGPVPGQDVVRWPASTPEAPAGSMPAAPGRRRRTGLVVSLVLVAVLVLCAGGGVAAYFLVQDAQPRGEMLPKAAVEGFLTAVFTDHSAQAAAAYVCPAARDEAELARLVSQVKTFAEKFDTPRTTWIYPPVEPDGRQAEVTVELTLATANEQVATKRVRLLLVEHRGWWVCDAQSA